MCEEKYKTCNGIPLSSLYTAGSIDDLTIMESNYEVSPHGEKVLPRLIRAAINDHQVVFIVGPTGVGKTRYTEKALYDYLIENHGDENLANAIIGQRVSVRADRSPMALGSKAVYMFANLEEYQTVLEEGEYIISNIVTFLFHETTELWMSIINKAINTDRSNTYPLCIVDSLSNEKREELVGTLTEKTYSKYIEPYYEVGEKSVFIFPLLALDNPFLRGIYQDVIRGVMQKIFTSSEVVEIPLISVPLWNDEELKGLAETYRYRATVIQDLVTCSCGRPWLLDEIKRADGQCIDNNWIKYVKDVVEGFKVIDVFNFFLIHYGAIEKVVDMLPCSERLFNTWLDSIEDSVLRQGIEKALRFNLLKGMNRHGIRTNDVSDKSLWELLELCRLALQVTYRALH